MMEDGFVPTKAELLAAWRDAAHAAELAERLATAASDAADQADLRTVASAEIAALAEEAAAAASRAAERAATAAAKAAELAKSIRAHDLVDAGGRLATARDAEAAARTAYQASDEEEGATSQRAAPR